MLWVVMNARAVRNPDGSTKYYEGTIEDITEQKKAADRLKSLNEFNAGDHRKRAGCHLYP